jgi:hypothetical protein
MHPFSALRQSKDLGYFKKKGQIFIMAKSGASWQERI